MAIGTFLLLYTQLHALLVWWKTWWHNSPEPSLPVMPCVQLFEIQKSFLLSIPDWSYKENTHHTHRVLGLSNPLLVSTWWLNCHQQHPTLLASFLHPRPPPNPFQQCTKIDWWHYLSFTSIVAPTRWSPWVKRASLTQHEDAPSMVCSRLPSRRTSADLTQTPLRCTPKSSEAGKPTA